MNKKSTYRIILLIAVLIVSGKSWAQLTVSGAKTPTELVEDVLLGTGVTASNITYTGAVAARGEFNSVNSNIGFDGGVILTSGGITNAVGPNNAGNRSLNNFQLGDPDIDAIIFPTTSRDAAVLEFDFRPISDTIMFNYVFALCELVLLLQYRCSCLYKSDYVYRSLEVLHSCNTVHRSVTPRVCY